jgi:mono/diheme cytochrome c family protein
MIRKLFIAGVIGVAVAVAAAFFYVENDREKAAGTFISPSDQQLVARGKVVYANHCAACHGANLEGQPNWRDRLPNGRLPAPPHDDTGHTWHHPDAVLIDIIKHGLVPGKTAPSGYESDMPAYGQLLPDADIVAVLAYIKSSWTSEALELQKQVTLQREQR